MCQFSFLTQFKNLSYPDPELLLRSRTINSRKLFCINHRYECRDFSLSREPRIEYEKNLPRRCIINY